MDNKRAYKPRVADATLQRKEDGVYVVPIGCLKP